MKIGLVIDNELLAGLIISEVVALGHQAVRHQTISYCAADGTGMIFVHWTAGPEFPRVLQEIVQFAKSDRPIPIVALVPENSLNLWDRARKSEAFDAIFCPPSRHEIRAEIEAFTGSIVPFDPIERERLERFRAKYLIGENSGFRRCIDDARRAAHSNVNVLLLGESGTGKDLLAQLIHQLSARAGHPFTAINCGAIASDLAESELFGSVRGGYTGAIHDRIGVFEQVGAGTLLLDEIGEMQLSHQVKVLRAIEQREFRRVGAVSTVQFKGRLICATSVNLDRADEQNSFRLDLLGRINQFRITLPPLRERKDDIAELVGHFVRKHSPGREVMLSSTALKLLEQRGYPDNLRGLENAVMSAITYSGSSSVILPQHLPEVAAYCSVAQEAAPTELLSEVDYREARAQACVAIDRLYLGKLLTKYPRNRRRLARAAGIDHKTLSNRLAKAFPELEKNPNE